MVQRAGFLLTFGLLVAGCAFGQLFPGQQSPGRDRFPGGMSDPFPGHAFRKFSGMLRRVKATSDIVIESDEGRIVTLSLARVTKYFKVSGEGAKLKDLQPGDSLIVDAMPDPHGYYQALRVTQIRQGSQAERDAALQPIEVSVTAQR
jgi:hypothetical protein